MKRLSEVCKITGVTRRTLQEYEKIGLLQPTVEENGYWMYSDEDISTLMEIQMLRMADFKRKEIKGIIQNDSLLLVANTIKDRLEEKKKKIEAMLGFVDMMQQVMEKGYDPKVIQIMRDTQSTRKIDSITQLYEDMIDYFSNTDQIAREKMFDLSYVATALLPVKEFPIESQVVQERAEECYSILRKMMIGNEKSKIEAGDSDAEAVVAFLEEGESFLAHLSDDEIDELKSEIITGLRDEFELSKYFRVMEETYGADYIDFVFNALTYYARENYPVGKNGM